MTITFTIYFYLFFINRKEVLGELNSVGMISYTNQKMRSKDKLCKIYIIL